MKYKIEMAPLADYYVVAVKDKSTGELNESFTLNESAADMLSLFCKYDDVSQVAKEMAIIYDVPIELITKDVEHFANKLIQKGLIRERENSTKI